MARETFVIGLVAALVLGCPQRAPSPHAPDAAAPRPTPRPEGDGAARAPEGDASPAPAPTPAPPPEAALGRCALSGPGTSISSVVAADVMSGTAEPELLVIRTPPEARPLAMTPEAGLPSLRVLYLVRPGREGAFRVTRLLDDPGPVRDHFERRIYERVAAASGGCHEAGCLIATAIERQVPDTPSSAFVVHVSLLDDEREPQGRPQPLAQEPDRGSSLAACVGASAEGFVVGTSVEGGRGRLLWLDARGTPLDVRYVAGGFSLCSARRAGLGVQVATSRGDGVELAELGMNQEADAGPAPALPSPPEGTTLAFLASAGSSPALVAAASGGTALVRAGADASVEVFDGRPTSMHAAEVGGRLYVAAVIDGQAAVAQLDAGLEPTARGEGLARAERAWIAPSSEGATLVWQEGDVLRLRGLACGTEAAAGAGEIRPIAPSAFESADRGYAGELRDRARRALSRDHHYRAGWLYERAFALDASSLASLRDSAAALTEIRFTQAARRVLQRLAEVGTSEAESLLRSTCRDSDFERQWRSGEYQRITGCAAPPERRDDEGEEEEGRDGDEDGDDESAGSPAAAPSPPAGNAAEAPAPE